MSNITFDFACRDDCLDKMVPSDLRELVSERDRLLEIIESLKDPYKVFVNMRRGVIVMLTEPQLRDLLASYTGTSKE